MFEEAEVEEAGVKSLEGSTLFLAIAGLSSDNSTVASMGGGGVTV